MLRQIKPRNARSKRALEKRAPKTMENPKKALFLRYTTCSQVVQNALADLYALRQPLAVKFSKKNSVHPFEDAAPLEFFSEKNDCSLLVFGSSSKKRPHALTLARTFAHKMLDMAELHLDPETFRSLGQFKTAKPAPGLRPLLVFAGAAFESETSDVSLVRSLLTDLFRGEEADRVDVEGLRYVVCVSAEDDAVVVEGGENGGSTGGSAASSPPIRVRAYLLRTLRSGTRLPRVEVEEMGPRLDFRVGRTRHADGATLKEAMKTPRRLPTEERTKKNVETSKIGDKLGRIHLGRQDLGELQTRKMKGLKRGRAVEDEGGGDGGQEQEIEVVEPVKKMKKR